MHYSKCRLKYSLSFFMAANLFMVDARAADDSLKTGTDTTTTQLSGTVQQRELALISPSMDSKQGALVLLNPESKDVMSQITALVGDETQMKTAITKYFAGTKHSYGDNVEAFKLGVHKLLCDSEDELSDDHVIKPTYKALRAMIEATIGTPSKVENICGKVDESSIIQEPLQFSYEEMIKLAINLQKEINESDLLLIHQSFNRLKDWSQVTDYGESGGKDTFRGNSYKSLMDLTWWDKGQLGEMYRSLKKDLYTLYKIVAVQKRASYFYENLSYQHRRTIQSIPLALSDSTIKEQLKTQMTSCEDGIKALAKQRLEWVNQLNSYLKIG